MPAAPIDFTLGMEPIEFVYSSPWSSPLPVTTIIPSKDEAVTILHALLADDGFVGSTW
jgi:hypothetical protein